MFESLKATELPTISTKTIADRIHQFQQSHIINGTVAVAKNNTTIYANSFGVADHTANQPCTIDTQFFIASITKQFTAAALLHVLWHQHPSIEPLKAALHKTIAHYLPASDSIWSGSMPRWANEVTLHHMLTHTSGLPGAGFQPSEETVLSPIEVAATFKDKPLLFNPGTNYQYCYSGYFLLSQIIERLSGKSLSIYLSDHFFKPLGMQNTFLPESGTCRSMKASGAYPNVARGYTYIKQPMDEVKLYGRNALLCGAGGIVSTISDLLIWNQHLHNNQVLPIEVTALMLTGHVQIDLEDSSTFYCYGIKKIKTPEGDIFRHDGGMAGFISTLQYRPHDQLSFVVLQNYNIYYAEEFKQIVDEECKMLAPIKNEQLYKDLLDQAIDKKVPGFLELKHRHEMIQLKDII